MISNELRTTSVNPVDRPVSALAAARRMCARSDWALTNLQLQKMLYLAQMMHLGKLGRPLFLGEFEAWDYGPVLPTVYEYAKAFGRDPVQSAFGGAPEVKDAERAKMLDDATDQLSKLPASRLVAITHWKDGAWAKNYVPGHRGIIISDADILDEYNRRFGAGAHE